MKELPERSSSNMATGIWFVHEDEDVIIKVWLSTLSGKEKVFLNEKLVAETRNITQLTTLHEFSYRDNHFDVEIYASNLFLMTIECNIFKNGKLSKAFINRIDQNGAMVVSENSDPSRALEVNLSRFRKKGIKKLQEFDVKEAITDLKKTLAIEPEDAETFFHLACAYSLSEEKEVAYDHLAKAVNYGLKGKDRILTEDKLAFLRIQPEFETFKEKHF